MYLRLLLLSAVAARRRRGVGVRGGDALYLTGGKFSTVERGETKFVYLNDVWRMRAADAH